jgi:hypothetical protein
MSDEYNFAGLAGIVLALYGLVRAWRFARGFVGG